MSELKPCPFCNIPPASITSKIDGKEYYSCLNVDCPNGSWLTADEWNARPIEDALNARIAELTAENAELEAERRWIPVSERLPEDGEVVWLWDGNNLGMGYYLIFSGCFMDRDTPLRRIKPTHWMSLPTPPEVK